MVFEALAPYFERYLTLERVHPTRTYNYKARGFIGWPVIEVTMHKPKCSAGSWLYAAVPEGSNLPRVPATERLYVGSQTSDRMFRGDGMDGINFHHAQMRAGNGDDNPVNYLRAGGRVDLHRMSESAMNRALSDAPALARLATPIRAMTKKHLGYWIEQVVLAEAPGLWRWNTAKADREALRLLAES